MMHRAASLSTKMQVDVNDSQTHDFLSAVSVALVAVLLPALSGAAEKQSVTTTVTVGEMCGGCVKRITAHFETVKEVAEVQCDIKTKAVVLFPAKNVRLSPRMIWETMESIGKEPKKLVSPDGPFPSKLKQT